MHSIDSTMIIMILVVAAAAAAPDATECARLWSCPAHATQRTSKRLRDYPGTCAPTLSGLALTKRSRWTTACRREFLELLLDRGACDHRETSRACVNLAPAGTGTLTLTRALRRVGLPECAAGNASVAPPPPGGCYHHRHGQFALHDAGAPCVVATLREPAARFASGLSYLILRDGKRGGASASPPRNVSDALAKFARRYEAAGGSRAPPAGFFGVPQVAHLAGLTATNRCGLHVLCTDTLAADLGDLGAHLAWPQLAAAAKEPRANDRSGGSSAVRAAVDAALTPAWRAWLNTEVYATDYAAYAVRCLRMPLAYALAVAPARPPL